MSRLVFLPILSISGVNITSGLPSNIVDLGCQCRVWSSFQYCRSRVSMSRLVFFQFCRSRVSMSRLVFLPILLISGVNIASGLPSNFVDLGCQCHVWSSFQFCRSRVSMSRLVFLPILSISGVNVASDHSSNIADLVCECRVWSSFQYCRSRVSMSRLVFLPILSISGLVFLPILLSSGVNVASGLPSNIVDLVCQCRIWYSFQYC